MIIAGSSQSGEFQGIGSGFSDEESFILVYDSSMATVLKDIIDTTVYGTQSITTCAGNSAENFSAFFTDDTPNIIIIMDGASYTFTYLSIFDGAAHLGGLET